MGRYLMILAALVWIGSTIAFLLYVPVFSVVSVALIVFGLALMFALGVEVGRTLPEPQPRPPKDDSRDENRVATPWKMLADFFSRTGERY